MIIKLLKNNETLSYAASELEKYIKMMDESINVTVSDTECDGENVITLGHLSDLGLYDGDVNDVMIDDVIDVDITGLSGHIAGSNDRSVLMGVYNFLKSAGCRWVRPGIDGEYIPRADISAHSFKYRKKADNPFRGECIEGAVSFEHVRDTVLWLPKVNMNLFMIEQIVPFNYMSRWYKHTVNTRVGDENLPYEKYCEYCVELEKLIKKLGLQLHVMGHGALTEPFGVRHMISGMDYDISKEAESAFALVKGKRGLYERSPFFTQVCMSQKWVRERIVKWLADYLDSKPYIDFLHFWLGDNINNHCECEECASTHPSDYYVMMLNDLDAELTKRNNNAKIVFIMYIDTLWAPVSEKLNDPSRFILTTATTRAKGDKYSDKRSENGIPPWKRNSFNIPLGFDMTLTFVDGWKKVFDGPKFIYEYYMYTDHFSDPGHMQFSRSVAEDMKSLQLTGFDGVMSDQTQRSFFPTGLPMAIIGEFQFDRSLDTEEFIDKYFVDSFGDDYALAREYLERITAIFDPKSIGATISVVSQDTGAEDGNKKRAGIFGNTEKGKEIEEIPDIVASYKQKFLELSAIGDKCHRESFKLLAYHCEYSKHLSKIYAALSRCDREEAKRCLAVAIDYLSEVESEIHPYFDLVLFAQYTRQVINL